MTTREELLADIRYREANPLTPEQVEVLVSEWLSKEPIPQDWRGAEPLHAQCIIWRYLNGHAVAFVPTLDGEKILVEVAETDPAAWDEACRQAAEYVETGEPVPFYLREFIGTVLRGAQRPKGGARKHFWKDFQICLAVEALVERAGYNATINPADDERQDETACGFVALQLGMPYNTVASIWSRRRKFRLNLERLFSSVMTRDRF